MGFFAAILIVTLGIVSVYLGAVSAALLLHDMVGWWVVRKNGRNCGGCVDAVLPEHAYRHAEAMLYEERMRGKYA